MGKSKKRKLPAVYQPVGWLLGWSGGMLASAAFRKVWMALRDEEDAPDALDPDRGWGEILVAAAIQGAIFAAVRSAVDRTGAKAIARATGVWPAQSKGGRD
ncbi:hypothetical protein SUDANB105_00387 [Streptomyces sp. enrichment culture]|uniref:DUF4235 domain-containing protein n=1 Tax=Streptomyces sp. enrichment culture TaxID=1795815 RepID=UPI003F56A2C7